MTIPKEENIYLTGSISKLFLKTATPIVLVMIMHGLYNIVDAYFLGEYVGRMAISAVSLMFPLQMSIFAISTLVSSGFSSILARRLGAKKFAAADQVFTNSHILALGLSVILISFYMIFGDTLLLSLARGSQELSLMSSSYITIIVYLSPIIFIQALHIDGLRCEGKLAFMGIAMIGANLLNILFNYIFIVKMNYGVAGSAYGTVLAQFSSLLLILLYRKMGKASLKIDFSGMKDFIPRTKEIFSLGAPGALGNLGVSLTAIITLYNLQEWGVSENYDLAVGAFGVITRVTIFTFMPLLGFNIAFQTIVGTNYGAGLKTRVNEILKFALTLSLGYCILIQAYFFWDADNLGLYFLADDPDLASETSRIITIITLLFFSFGPTSIIASYFQAIGDAKRAAILNIARTYFFAIPLIYIMPQIFDKLGLIAEPAIWYARPIAEIGMIILTFITLRHNARKNGLRYGILSN